MLLSVLKSIKPGVPSFPLSLLTVYTQNIIASFGGSTVKVDTKHQKVFTGRISTILLRSKCSNHPFRLGRVSGLEPSESYYEMCQ